MDLTTINYTDFKDMFFRDFPYLNIWAVSETYNTDDEVYYSVNGFFYRCLNDTVSTVPTDTNDWLKITDTVNNYILDADIQKAFIEARMNFNQSLFASDTEIQLAYLYLTAMYLVVDLRNSSQGINSKGLYNAQSQSVGNVSESLHIPDAIVKNPAYHIYTTNGYGMKYLSFVLPKLVGNVGTVTGGTNA